jgi:hypothetical protein
VARKLFSWLLVLTPSVAFCVAALGLISYALDRSSQPGVIVPDSVRDLGDVPTESEFQVTILVRNDGSRRCRIVGVGGEC